jgi:hypothetical protein
MLHVVVTGVFGGAYSVDRREAAYGVKFSHVLIFQQIYELDYEVVASNIDNGYAVILNIGMHYHNVNTHKCMNTYISVSVHAHNA